MIKLYLAHPTLSRGKLRIWELKTEKKLNVELANPFYDNNNEEIKKVDNGVLSPFGYTPKAKEIVNDDLNLLDTCNGLLGIIDKNTAIGVFMEVFYAKLNHKPIILVCSNKKYRYHPWLLYCADIIFDNFSQFEEYWKNRKQEKQTLIGICGRKGVGKDTAAKYLIEKYGFKQFAFADEIKNTIKNTFGFSLKNIESRKNEIRPLLQKIGTKIREIEKDVWINIVLSRIENYQYVLPDLYNKVVISDVRLLEEVEILRKNGYKIWKIVGYGEIDKKDTHITEMEINHIVSDRTIVNIMGDIRGFYNSINISMENV